MPTTIKRPKAQQATIDAIRASGPGRVMQVRARDPRERSSWFIVGPSGTPGTTITPRMADTLCSSGVLVRQRPIGWSIFDDVQYWILAREVGT